MNSNRIANFQGNLSFEKWLNSDEKNEKSRT